MTMPGPVHCHLQWPKCPPSKNSTPFSMFSSALSNPEHISITAINIDALTETWATITMPVEIGPNQCGSLRCKVNTSASGNVMPLHILATLFPRHITRDGKPTRLHHCDTRLMAYDGSNIAQFGALDTAIEWTPKVHQLSKDFWTRCYVADSAGRVILGLPSIIKTGNCPAELCGQTHKQT